MKKKVLLKRSGKYSPLTLRDELRFYHHAMKPFKWLFALVILLLIMVWAGSCLSPVLQKNLIDAFNNSDRNAVILYGILSAAALGIWRGGETLWGLLASTLNIRVSSHLKQGYFRHLLKLPLGVIESGGAGYLGQRLQLDVENATSFLCGGLFSLLLNFLKLSGAMILLSFQTPEMMFATIPILLIFMFLVWIFRSRQFELSLRVNEAAAEYRRNMQNSLDRMTLFKSRSAERRVDRRVSRNLERLTMLRLSRVRWERFYTVSLQLLPAIWCGLVWCYGALKVLDKSWTLGELWAVSTFMLLIFSTGKMFFSGILVKRNSDAAMSRLSELKKMLPERNHDTASSRIKAAHGDICFDRISFAYPGGKSVFNGFSLEIADGEHVGICGPSGGGKSTLGALLLRLYDVSGGEIRLDGRALKDYSLHALRQSVGYIGQSAELFFASVRENLSHGGGHSDARMCEALCKVGLGARLKDNPELLDLQIREDGSNFSAGERLKLALARELLRDTKVLVLDEATASLDRDSEKTVFELLRGEWKNRTVIFISHREFPADVMDKVIKINGRG